MDVLDYELYLVFLMYGVGLIRWKGLEFFYGILNVIRFINKLKWNLKIDYCFFFIIEFSFKVC